MSEITIISAFFDIGRGDFPEYARTTDDYVEYFKFWARIKNRLVVYTSSEHAEKVMRIRAEYNLADRTSVIVNDDVRGFDMGTFSDIKTVMSDPEYLAFREYRTNPECVFPLYNYIMYLKPFLVTDAIQRGLVGDTAAWLDFGYNHGGKYYTNSEDFDYLWSYDCADKIHFFAVKELDDRPIREIVRDMWTYFSGAVMVAPTRRWHELQDYYRESMRYLIDNKLVDDDQTLQVMAYRMHPENFKIHQVDSFFQGLYLTGGEHLRINIVKKHKYKEHKLRMRDSLKKGRYLDFLKHLGLYIFHKLPPKQQADK